MKLELRDIRGGYGKKIVLDGVEFSVREGSVVSLLGPNGCGKSTLLKIIGRILRPESGSVLLDGREIHEFNTRILARKLALLPQLKQSPSEMTVEELVACGRFPHGRTRYAFLGRDRDMVEESIRMTRLEDLRKRRLETLSGGECQRAWIAMALAQEPELLLLDEPTAFLDIGRQFELLELIRTLNRKKNLTVVMVLHNLNLAALCSDELILMKQRRIHCAGSPKEVMTPGNLKEIFDIECSVVPGPGGVPHCIASGSTSSAFTSSGSTSSVSSVSSAQENAEKKEGVSPSGGVSPSPR